MSKRSRSKSISHLEDKWWKKQDRKDKVLARKLKDHPKYYVAYGSNHNVLQMQQRCKTAMPVCTADLHGYKLIFSGVLTIEACEDSHVPCSVWKVGAEDIIALDRYEGYPTMYEKFDIDLTLPGGKLVKAFTYYLNEPYEQQLPFGGYYTTVAEGYQEWGLDFDVLLTSMAMAEDAEFEYASKPVVCVGCGEVLPAGQMTYKRLKGWLCPECDRIFNYPWVGRDYWGTSASNWNDPQAPSYSDRGYPFGHNDTKPSESRSEYYWPGWGYDDGTGMYFDPAELDWSGSDKRSLYDAWDALDEDAEFEEAMQLGGDYKPDSDSYLDDYRATA